MAPSSSAGSLSPTLLLLRRFYAALQIQKRARGKMVKYQNKAKAGKNKKLQKKYEDRAFDKEIYYNQATEEGIQSIMHDYRQKGLIVIDVLFLSVTFQHKPSFEGLNLPLRSSVTLVEPLAVDGFYPIRNFTTHNYVGKEAVGVVTAVGPGLTGRKVGDVAYAGNSMGAYAEEQILPAEMVVPVPPSIDPIIAASIMLKGMTAEYLVRRCFKVEPGHTVLIHAAAGGVGSLLCQWANALGATVIGTVSTKEKAAQAKEDGCHHVILYKEHDFVSRVSEITSGEEVEVVYDSVGKDTFEGSLACLKPRGYMVSFGQSSGNPDPVPLSALASRSLFLTRPTLMHYTMTRDELLQTASEVFTNVASGVLRPHVNHTYPLSQAAQAHADLESRKTSGSVVLIPDGC
ncbi:hypothetical protein OROGR_022734 [Orobanche gracilis]